MRHHDLHVEHLDPIAHRPSQCGCHLLGERAAARGDAVAVLVNRERVVGGELVVHDSDQVALDQVRSHPLEHAVVLEHGVRVLLTEPPPDRRVPAGGRLVGHAQGEAVLLLLEVVVRLDRSVHLGDLLPRPDGLDAVGTGPVRLAERGHDAHVLGGHRVHRSGGRAQHGQDEQDACDQLEPAHGRLELVPGRVLGLGAGAAVGARPVAVTVEDIITSVGSPLLGGRLLVEGLELGVLVPESQVRPDCQDREDDRGPGPTLHGFSSLGFASHMRWH
ncbi:MAG: hypothetical protein JWL85_134 [Candidatus Saccharibacteria bacterium]|nr:hypothetical protein [Candidatus Saccharibacteria bacterium]